LPALFQAGIGTVDVGLLGRQVGVMLTHFGVCQPYRRPLAAQLAGPYTWLP
jgi:hypothetical protein